MTPEPPDEEKPEEEEAPRVSSTGLPDPPEWEWKRPKAEKGRPPASSDMRSFRGMGVGMSIGFVMVMPVLLGVGIGTWLDRLAGGGNMYLLIGVLLGAVAGFTLMIRLVDRMNRDGE
ncbi:MAG: AtpZ/AtpI family protein [Armatimonadetes bacterium]|nr:AtpZ/AtpI family protein [Armatimonadota bacterium]